MKVKFQLGGEDAYGNLSDEDVVAAVKMKTLNPGQCHAIKLLRCLPGGGSACALDP